MTKKKDPGESMDRFDARIKAFKGQLPTLENAIGAYVVGRRLGWKILYLVHEKRTIRKWEEILDIKFRDELPPTTELSRKSYAWTLAQKLSNFWKAVSGETKVTVGGKERTVRDAKID